MTGKRVLIGCAVLLLLAAILSICLFALAPAKTSGSLDPTFNPLQGYVMSTDAEDFKDRGIEVAVQPDGKIVTLGYANNSHNDDLVLSRFTAEGKTDAAFGSGCFVRYDGGDNDKGLGLTLQADGKILATGFTTHLGNRDLLLLRYESNGSLDRSFGNNGVVTFDSPGSSTDIGFAVTCEADGGIMVAGEVSNKTHQDVLVLHYTPAGILDIRFGKEGVFTYGKTGLDRGFDATIQKDEKIVVTGSTVTNRTDDALLLRINPDGTLDQTFGRDGTVTYSSEGDRSDYGNYVALQADGKIVVSGATTIDGAYELLVLRYNPDGSPDVTFGDTGVIHYGDIGGNDDYGYAHVIQRDGKIVIVGYSGESTSDEVLVVRFNPSGEPDTSFGTGGRVMWNGPGNNRDYGQGIALQPDGKIVVTGFSHHNASEDLLVMRLLP
jgi:uncharacterized delta-60 repeat protein